MIYSLLSQVIAWLEKCNSSPPIVRIWGTFLKLCKIIGETKMQLTLGVMPGGRISSDKNYRK